MEKKNAFNVKRLLQPFIEGKTVLDLGCVDHTWTKALSEDWLHYFILKHAKMAIGIDYLKDDVQKIAALGFDVRYGDAENLDLHTKFDVIVAAELIEHLENFRGFLESCKKHMTLDSKLIITTPNSYSASHYACNFVNKPYTHPDHVCWFDKQTLTHLLKRHDLEVEESHFLFARQKGMRGTVMWALGNLPQSAPGLFVVARRCS